MSAVAACFLQWSRLEKAHRAAANATMIDSDNVLLLRLVIRLLDSHLKDKKRPPRGSRNVQGGFVAATIYYFDEPVNADFISILKTRSSRTDGGRFSVLAYFVTEDSPNNYPQLPVREGEYVFVWFAGFQDQEAYESHLARLESIKKLEDEISKFLKKHL